MEGGLIHMHHPWVNTRAALVGWRGGALFELAIAQPLLDMPEALWKVG